MMISKKYLKPVNLRTGDVQTSANTSSKGKLDLEME